MVHSNLSTGTGKDMSIGLGDGTTTTTYNRGLSPEQHRLPNNEYSPPALDGTVEAYPLTAAANGAPRRSTSVKEGLGGKDGSVLSVPNGTGSDRAPSAKSVALSMKSRRSMNNLSATNLSVSDGGERRSGEAVKEATTRPGAAEEGYFTAIPLANGRPPAQDPRSPLNKPVSIPNTEPITSQPTRSFSHGQVPMTPSSALPPVEESSPQVKSDGLLRPPGTTKAHRHRASSPPAFDPSQSLALTTSRPDRLTHRHTLEVPSITTRTSKDGGDPSSQLDGAVLTTGRFSPNTPTRRRASLQLARRNTRSIHSDMHLDEIPRDEDAARWAEHIRAKRASKKQRADTDDDRVVVGTKVDQNHVNFVTAYNMLTGIRCCVSRTNAKLDRDLTDSDFETKHKFSFDISGSELTPSSKYDFKFKDYAPFVFRKLRGNFKLDPADYLMSLTSKYILSELGSPGKSGSFFYFSRDYKYIIKTIHHGEHKFLRMILRDYYNHVTENPNTLLSQFYGLHRVKIPYGRKIHFVVMNNLFPPHRDIHRTFDLKGSTIGRDFREEDLEKNPRATLKDLNWLRRNLHLEFGPTKKEAFVTQMQKDVALLQRLKIMDYSMLVGIHDLERGNEENLRDKTLRVFQPGGEEQDDGNQRALDRTPSKMENAKRVKEMREAVKRQKPVPISQTLDKMPDEAHRSPFFFYADDGGFRATHEDDGPGEEIYYLGIIDCLTRYTMLKRIEHAWKGMGGHESQISPIPPERYGDRFIRFISGITMSRERAEQQRLSSTLEVNAGITIPAGIEGTVSDDRLGSINLPLRDSANPPGTDKVIRKAEHQAEKSRRKGSSEEEVPDRSILAVRSPGDPQTEQITLPVIGEAAENSSNVSVSRTSSQVTPHRSYERMYNNGMPVIGNANMPPEAIGEIPPPTPPKLDGTTDRRSEEERRSWQSGGLPPPTPPKETRRMANATDDSYADGGCFSIPRTTKIQAFQDKELPLPPTMALAQKQLSATSTGMSLEPELNEKRSGLLRRKS
ncbi:Putative phosphatidylinositol-4-phosphate 5-kinase, core [Septoria linicola]|uniref:1-phosphatidylinositol-4-phosphate 5-kinase n=1 Tax=Septoria linicola TaxID=215465 RepID=A0A9Q9B2K8_9PEZI|nr:putative phosphatidylinositol-4-phosphate 5-kinase, core [Septoria linicola]USW59495.1 Putative phosphatidylinositol-4-phosphate 5-kinase, core [Septoria linicola]